MKGMVGPTLAALAVLYALTVLLSVDRTASGPALVKSKEEISDLGSRLIQTVMLQRRQQQSQDHPGSADADQTMKVQQALKDNGFYAGPIDGVMRKRTQEAIQSFQRSKHLEMTGAIDEDTARELHIR